MGRFMLYAALACVAAFVGVSWILRGFPISVAGPIGVGELAPLPPHLNTTFGDTSVRDAKRKLWELSQPDAGKPVGKQYQIRIEALQAANAYAASPCDPANKARLIAALAAYTRAWQERLNCNRVGNSLMGCGEKKIDDAAFAFTTPLDLQVHEAFKEAFEQGGVIKADIPAAVRFDSLKFTSPELWLDELPLCLPQMRANAGLK
jgi:hypothetical protein